VDGLFGAGDVTTVPYNQIVISAGEGAKAALSAHEYLLRKGL
jgi:alkyl hydroperoxide reductase subunit F